MMAVLGDYQSTINTFRLGRPAFFCFTCQRRFIVFDKGNQFLKKTKRPTKGSQPEIANGSDVDSVHVKLANIEST
jgi:hypothetical protein